VYPGVEQRRRDAARTKRDEERPRARPARQTIAEVGEDQQNANRPSPGIEMAEKVLDASASSRVASRAMAPKARRGTSRSASAATATVRVDPSVCVAVLVLDAVMLTMTTPSLT
jgi:hypothetical protein